MKIQFFIYDRSKFPNIEPLTHDRHVAQLHRWESGKKTMTRYKGRPTKGEKERRNRRRNVSAMGFPDFFARLIAVDAALFRH